MIKYIFLLITSVGGICAGAKTGSISDINGAHEYMTVRICNQEWMAENLAYLPQIDRVQYGVLDDGRFLVYDIKGYCLEEAEKTDFYKKYGFLRNWKATIYACPDGWYLPADEEWQKMERYLGMKSGASILRNWRRTGYLGKQLIATSMWFKGSGSDESGFKALQGDCGGYNGCKGHRFYSLSLTATAPKGDIGLRRTVCLDKNRIEWIEDRYFFECSVCCAKD